MKTLGLFDTKGWNFDLDLGLEFSIINNRTKMVEASPHGKIVKDNIYISICDELGFLTQNAFPIFVKTQPRP